MAQYNTIQYNTIQYNTIQYNTIQYNTIQYNTIFGIRHDTYIDNYLVVEYRNPDKFWEVVRFFEEDNPNVLKV